MIPVKNRLIQEGKASDLHFKVNIDVMKQKR